MNIRFNNGTFIADSTFQEKDELKAAGFRWNPDTKKWWTSDPLTAAEFEEVADDEAKAEIEAAQQSIAASNSSTVETDIEIPIPEGKSLFPYQRAGVEFAYKRNATLIGDEMGLGKTVQAIALINVCKPETVLIICPATLKLNWQKECNRWITEPRRVHVLSSGDTFPTVPDIVVMNYDIATKYKDQIRAIRWGLLICDEAHYMKNPKAQRTVAIVGKGKKEVGIRADKKIFLTGTPITNRPVEIWPLVNYLFPAQFPDFWPFAKRYCDAYQNGYGWDFSGASDLEHLQQSLRSAGMLRRLKSQVLKELPAKMRQVICLPSDSVSRLINQENKHGAELELRVKGIKAEARRLKAAGNTEGYKDAVNQLRKAYGVAFEEMAAIRKELAIAKIPLVIEHLTDIIEAGEKVVVMAHHRVVIDAIQNHFGLQAVKLYGGMSDAEKESSVSRFQTDEYCRLFIGSIRAAGVGITLTASSNVVFAELDWTPANMLQAEDRCHRIGQEESVLIQHLVFDGSLDSKMAETLVNKMEVIGAALDEVDI